MINATEYLESFIPKTDMNRFSGDFGLKRAAQLQAFLGSPQEKLRVIHIAGTSGKGSTAMILSTVLAAQGKKVGLHVKPHMLDIRERFQINNQIISAEKFEKYLAVLKQAVQKMDDTEFGRPTYFEVIVSLAYYIFAEEGVEYAVIETGVGGQFDGSNTVQRAEKVALLSKIGFDHMGILGNTIPEIAHQKAMIMHQGNTAFTVPQEKEVMDVFNQVARDQGGDLHIIQFDPQTVQVANGLTTFDFTYKSVNLKNLELGMIGDYQAENATLALNGLYYVAERDGFEVDEPALRLALKKIVYPGRFEIRSIKEKTVIIDGAHNMQKLTAFLDNVQQLYPKQKYSFIVGFKEGKEIESMVNLIAPLAHDVIVTGFFNDKVDFLAVSEAPSTVEAMFHEHGIQDTQVYEHAKDSVVEVPQLKESVVVITGSLYMIAEMYPGLKKLSGEL